MKISPFFIFLLSFIIFSTCKDRPRSNPFDPDTVLDTSQWAPSNLQVEVINDSQIHLTWEQEDYRIEGFRILRKAGSSNYIQIAENTSDSTHYTDTELIIETEYTYRVNAFTETNESAFASSVSTTTTSFPPPTNLTAAPVDDQSIHLTWTHTCDFEDGYWIERSEGGSFTQIVELGVDVNSYTDTGLSLGVTYTYRVKAFTETNESGYATSTPTSTSFPPPTSLTATPIDDQTIHLTWTHNCDFEEGYRIERKSGSSSFEQIAEVIDNIFELTDTGLNFGAEYTYRVKAFTETNESGFVTSTPTTTSFPVPTNLTATPIDDQTIHLTWTHTCNFETGYQIERSEGGSFTQIAEVGVDVNNYTDTGLPLGVTYTYRVKAYTETNESGYVTSAPISTSFPAPTNLTATPIDDQSIYLTWTHTCDFEAGYRIERKSGSSSFEQIAEVIENIFELTDTGLSLGVTYTYRVKAFTSINESDFTEVSYNFWYDCADEWGGNLVVDCSGICGGDAIIDCNGVCEGLALINNCGYCVSGNTGIHLNYCGNVSDIDGNVYETVAIGSQVWLAENLKVTHYRSGSPIQFVPSGGIWVGLFYGAYCYYNSGMYGNLYNWFAVSNIVEDICPEDWHVPIDSEWQLLIGNLGGNSDIVGGKLKDTGTIEGGDGLWFAPNTGATNESSFTALPGGFRDINGGSYVGIGQVSYFWSNSEATIGDDFVYEAWARGMDSNSSHIFRWNENTRYGLSVRCVRDY